VEYASRLNIDNVPSVERWAAALINTARGFVRRGEDESAALVLLDAEQVCADEVHDSILVRELLRELVYRDRARARSHVRGLAQRCGLATSVRSSPRSVASSDRSHRVFHEADR
jgi:hypothetical protein